MGIANYLLASFPPDIYPPVNYPLPGHLPPDIYPPDI